MAARHNATASGSVDQGSARPKRKVKTRKALPSLPAETQREATVHEAKTHLSRLLNEVEAGGTVIITRRGKRIAKIEAVRDRPKRVFGSMKGLIGFDESFFDPLPEDELKLWNCE